MTWQTVLPVASNSCYVALCEKYWNSERWVSSKLFFFFFFLTKMKRVIKQQVALQLFFISPSGGLFAVRSELAENPALRPPSPVVHRWMGGGNFNDDSAPTRAIIINPILIRRRELWSYKNALTPYCLCGLLQAGVMKEPEEKKNTQSSSIKKNKN